jgi:hypothetical protein
VRCIDTDRDGYRIRSPIRHSISPASHACAARSGPPVAIEIDRTGKPRADRLLPYLELSIVRVISGADLDVKLHNLGSVPARDIAVALLNSEGAKVAEERVPAIEAAVDQRPRSTLFRGGARARPAWALRADPENTVEELDDTNNDLRIESR